MGDASQIRQVSAFSSERGLRCSIRAQSFRKTFVVPSGYRCSETLLDTPLCFRPAPEEHVSTSLPTRTCEGCRVGLYCALRRACAAGCDLARFSLWSVPYIALHYRSHPNSDPHRYSSTWFTVSPPPATPPFHRYLQSMIGPHRAFLERYGLTAEEAPLTY